MCHKKYDNHDIPVLGGLCAIFTCTLPICLCAGCCSYTYYKCCSCKNNNDNENINININTV